MIIEEKLTLTKEQEERFMIKFMQGDIWGIEELQKIVKEELKIRDTDMYYTIYDLLKDISAVNGIYVWGLEDTGALNDYYTEIEKLYSGLKTELFDSFTNDFEKYYNGYKIDTKYSEQGRIINKKVDDNFIKMYLGLENIIDNFGAVKEYIEFEEKYFNQNVDFCLNCDIDRFTSEEDIIEKGQYLVVFR